MDLCNPTGDTIRTMFDSVPYIFGPRSVLTVPDEAGRHIHAQGSRFGLVEVHFGDDADKIRYVGLRARMIYYNTILEGHKRLNEQQAEKKFPPIVDSDAVRQARIAFPIYEKALGKLEEKLGDEAAAAYQKDLEAMLLQEAIPLPQLKDASLTMMRDECTRLGIAWKPGWNYIELREAIEAQKAVSQVAPAAITPGPPAASGIAVQSGPDPNVAPDALVDSPFTRI